MKFTDLPAVFEEVNYLKQNDPETYYLIFSDNYYHLLTHEETLQPEFKCLQVLETFTPTTMDLTMQIEEYIKLSDQFDLTTGPDSLDPAELTQFITVWIKSRSPALYDSLKRDFIAIESNIYAHRECVANKYDI
jgi:hypothetical protein